MLRTSSSRGPICRETKGGNRNAKVELLAVYQNRFSGNDTDEEWNERDGRVSRHDAGNPERPRPSVHLPERSTAIWQFCPFGGLLEINRNRSPEMVYQSAGPFA